MPVLDLPLGSSKCRGFTFAFYIHQSQRGERQKALLGSLDYVASSIVLKAKDGKVLDAAKASVHQNELVIAALSLNEKVLKPYEVFECVML